MVVAVSGGGDSLALLLLLHDHLRQNPALTLRLLAVTVDHGLRPEAAAEARHVAALCADLGIDHRTMRWDAAKPATGISEAARAARQRLLVEAATDAGADLIFLAHTADDVAETVAMRSERGAGRGLAGIAPATLYDGRVWFLRPLLAARRADLRDFLGQRGIRWIDDPTNVDTHYERARIRQSLSEGDIARLLAVAREAGETRERLGRAVAGWFRHHLRLLAPGLFSVPADELAGLPEDVRTYAFRIILGMAGGASQLPDEARASALLAGLLHDGCRATLARAVVARQRGHLWFHREGRNLPRLPAVDGLLWDNRFRLRLRAPADHDIVIGPMGKVLASEADFADGTVPKGLARAAFAAEPVLLGSGEPVRQIDGCSLTRIKGPWVTLVPSFDYEPAAALSALVGGEILPARPRSCHKQG